MLNRIILIGRLTKDPELRYTPNGVAVASFTLAVDRRFSKEGQQDTDFINIVAWNKLGENCANYLAKGKLAGVDGELHIRSYDIEVEHQPQKRWVTEVVADNVRFLSPKDGGGQQGSNALGNEISFNDDDIPF